MKLELLARFTFESGETNPWGTGWVFELRRELREFEDLFRFSRLVRHALHRLQTLRGYLHASSYGRALCDGRKLNTALARSQCSGMPVCPVCLQLTDRETPDLHPRFFGYDPEGS